MKIITSAKWRQFLMLISLFCTLGAVAENYTLRDDDVVVTDGVIISCSYDFSIKSIIIPDTLDGQSVTGITDKEYPDGIFYKKGIVGITLPTKLMSIGDYAFFMNSIDSLDLSACIALTAIGNSAFRDNSISSLDLSACTTLTSIGESAFKSNSIDSLDLSTCTALTSIGDRAFMSNSISSLDLSACTALTTIGTMAFFWNSIFSFTLPSPNYSNFTEWIDNKGTTYADNTAVSDMMKTYFAKTYYTLTDDDVVVTDGVITSCSYNPAFNCITIPSTLDGQSVTGIADGEHDGGIFYNMDIIEITLPATLKSIGYYAFAGNSLSSLDLSACTALISIEERAFYFSNLPSIDFSACSALTTIGKEAFHGNSISSIDLSACMALITIGEKAFNNNSITSVDLSTCTALTSIGEEAFNNNSITTLDLRACTALTTIGDFAFSHNSITSLDLRTCTALTVIGKKAFYSNFIISLDLSESTALTTIREEAFSSNSITSLNLNSCISITSIERGVFSSNSITSLDFSTCTTLTAIGNGAFSDNSITSINFSTCTALSSIGDYAFKSNSITSLDLRACTALTAIGNYAFRDNSISNLDLSASTTLTAIGKEAFSYNSITSLDLRACTALSAIGDYAFAYNSIDSLNLSASSALSAIGNYAFSRNSIDSLNLSACAALISIGQGAFYRNNLSNFALPVQNNDISVWTSSDGNTYGAGDVLSDLAISYECAKNYIITFVDWDTSILKIDTLNYGSDAIAPASPSHTGFTFIEWDTTFENISKGCTIKAEYSYTLKDDDVVVTDGVITSCNFDFAVKNIIIPDTLDGQSLTGIADGEDSSGVFYNKGIVDITLPTTLTSIGDYAFYKNSIDSLYLRTCTALTSIGMGAFGANNISSLDLDSCTALIFIGDKAFKGNSISSFTLPTPKVDNFSRWIDGNERVFAVEDAVSDMSTSYEFTKSYIVTFVDWDASTLKIDTVSLGRGAIAPIDPTRTGYTFAGWDTTFTSISESYTVRAEYEITAGIDVVEMKMCILYPNPATDQVTVSGVQGQLIELYSLSGTRMMQQMATSDDEVLHIDFLQSGVYIVKVGHLVEQLIVE